MMLTQNIFHQGKYNHTISMISNLLVLFKNQGDKLYMNILANPICPQQKSYFMERTNDATKPAYGLAQCTIAINLLK